MKTTIPLIISGAAILAFTPPTHADSYTVPLFSAGAYYFVADELDNLYGNYISNVLYALTPFDSVLKLDTSKQAFYIAGGADTLRPGEGAIILNNSPSQFLTFNGAQGTNQGALTLIPGQFRLVSRRTGGLGPSSYEDLVGAPPVEGSTLLLWDPPLQDYIYCSYHNNLWNWSNGYSNAPSLARGASALVVLQPALTLSNNLAGQIVIGWTAPQTWTLEAAGDLAGPWTTVTNATNPYIASPSPGNRFYRLHGNLLPPPDIGPAATIRR